MKCNCFEFEENFLCARKCNNVKNVDMDVLLKKNTYRAF